MAEPVHRIAVVIPKYGLVGGAEGFAAELTERLARDPRWEFHVFANRWIARSDRIRFHRVPVISFPKFLTTPSFAFFADRRIRKAKIDLIHTHERIFQADLFTMHGVPHRYWIREVRRKGMSLYDRATAHVEESLVHNPRCRLFLPVSGLTREIFLREYKVDPDLVRVVHPGVDPGRYEGLDRSRCREEIARRFKIAPDERVVLFVSMNFEIKGLDTLIKALAALTGKPSAPAFRLLVVGKGNVKKYQDLAASLGIGERVTFTGVIPGAMLPTFYEAADLYAMLSAFDTFGMVVLEAMAASLPVLISDHVGAKDIVREGVNGFVIPGQAKTEEISQKLGTLLQADVRKRMGRAARETAREHTWDAAAGRIAGIYEELLARQPERS
ncbi:MAG: glycosyltransferase family 4 protein [Syntrophaceae bacterium]|nr:glycosyltransferase family 4 protein [Syntrophaceae bacterium]